MTTSLPRLTVIITVATLVVSACSAAPPTPEPSSVLPSLGSGELPTAGTSDEPGPSTEPSTSQPAGGVSEECMAANLTDLKNEGRLTLSTDNPAYPPWWGGDPDTQYPDEPEGGSGWETSDPYSMEGYESATAYAVADALGFTPDQVDWIQNTVFAQAFRPGRKEFDFHMAQISIRERRAQNVDFSEPYFQANQSIIALADDEIQGATTIESLKEFRLGAQVGTTSFDLIEDVIAPTAEASVFDDNNAARLALQNGQIDGLVVDLQTAFYMRDVQIDGDSAVVGQFDQEAQSDPVGMVLQKGSPLTACVNEALAAIKADGTLDAIYDQWISTGQEIPFFE